MKYLRLTYLLLLFVVFSAGSASAQAVPAGEVIGGNINVVILVLATIFAGIILFLIYLERKLSRLEKRANQQ